MKCEFGCSRIYIGLSLPGVILGKKLVAVRSSSEITVINETENLNQLVDDGIKNDIERGPFLRNGPIKLIWIDQCHYAIPIRPVPLCNKDHSSTAGL